MIRDRFIPTVGREFAARPQSATRSGGEPSYTKPDAHGWKRIQLLTSGAAPLPSRALQKNDGRGINGTGTYPFTEDCHRIENGSPTTNVPLRPDQDPNALNVFSMSCLEAFGLGMYYVVQNIHHRRYTVVDRERGVVYSHSVLDQGTVNSGTLSDGRTHSYAGFNRPSSILVTEAFLIEDGKIRSVEMVGPSVPYHMNSPWGGLSGN
jgi:hypothetical protein